MSLSKIKPNFFQGPNPNNPTLLKNKINEIIDALNDIDENFVSGPNSSTDNAVARFDGITGKIIQNSSVTIDDSGVIAGATIGNTNTAIFKDTLFTLQDDGDTSKQLKFQLSGITTATTRTLTVPDGSNTLVLTTVGTSGFLPFFNGNGFTLSNSIVQQSGTTTTIIGTGVVATDYILKFDGNTNDSLLTWKDSIGCLNLTRNTGAYFDYPGWKSLFTINEYLDYGSAFTAWLAPSAGSGFHSAFFGGMQDSGSSAYGSSYAVGLTGYNYINATNSRTFDFLAGNENTTEFGSSANNLTVTDLAGTNTWAGVKYGGAGTVTVTRAYGLRVLNSSGFTPGTHYGIYVADIATGTNKYALYIASQTGYGFISHASANGIGTSSPANRLSIVTPAGQYAFGIRNATFAASDETKGLRFYQNNSGTAFIENNTINCILLDSAGKFGYNTTPFSGTLFGIKGSSLNFIFYFEGPSGEYSMGGRKTGEVGFGLDPTVGTRVHIRGFTSDGSNLATQIVNSSDIPIANFRTDGVVSVRLGKTASYVTNVGGMIFDHSSDAGNTGTSETTMYTDTTIASTLGTNGDKICATYGGIFVSSATATRQIKVKFNSSTIFDSGTLTISASASWVIYVDIIRVSSSVIRYAISMNTQNAALAAYTSVGELTGLTLSNNNVMEITGQAAGVGAATNDIVAKMGYLEWKPNIS